MDKTIPPPEPNGRFSRAVKEARNGKTTATGQTMNKIISAAEANRQFSRVLKDVKDGKSYTVTNHGEPVARIIPAEKADSREEARKILFARLESQPVRNIGRWTRDELYDDNVA